MKLGDEVEVKVIEVDREGRVRFSRKELLPKPEGYEERPRPPRVTAATAMRTRRRPRRCAVVIAAVAATAVARGGGRDRRGPR